MHILTVFVAIPGFMATIAGCAPLQGFCAGNCALVEDPQFQEIVLRSLALTDKIRISIPDTHKSCIHTETLQLNSSENAYLATMASNIRFPSAPVLKVVSENFTLESSVRQMSEGLQLHRALLNFVSPLLQNQEKVADLMDDIRDLTIQINKMLKMLQAESAVQPTHTPVALQLSGEYEVQVAAHLTLEQLQGFLQDIVRCLRSLVPSFNRS
ncbi:uncharacterized protein ACBR49_018675 [Aulostomus maculatus]